MEKSESKKYPEADRKPPEVPTREAVHGWIKRDISAASYFLSMLLRYPDIIEGMAGEVYARILKDEQGAAIDHIKEDERSS